MSLWNSHRILFCLILFISLIFFIFFILFNFSFDGINEIYRKSEENKETKEKNKENVLLNTKEYDKVLTYFSYGIFFDVFDFVYSFKYSSNFFSKCVKSEVNKCDEAIKEEETFKKAKKNFTQEKKLKCGISMLNDIFLESPCEKSLFTFCFLKEIKSKDEIKNILQQLNFLKIGEKAYCESSVINKIRLIREKEIEERKNEEKNQIEDKEKNYFVRKGKLMIKYLNFLDSLEEKECLENSIKRFLNFRFYNKMKKDNENVENLNDEERERKKLEILKENFENIFIFFLSFGSNDGIALLNNLNLISDSFFPTYFSIENKRKKKEANFFFPSILSVYNFFSSIFWNLESLNLFATTNLISIQSLNYLLLRYSFFFYLPSFVASFSYSSFLNVLFKIGKREKEKKITKKYKANNIIKERETCALVFYPPLSSAVTSLPHVFKNKSSLNFFSLGDFGLVDEKTIQIAKEMKKKKVGVEKFLKELKIKEKNYNKSKKSMIPLKNEVKEDEEGGGIDFVLALGDNFYEFGVESCDSTKWQVWFDNFAIYLNNGKEKTNDIMNSTHSDENKTIIYNKDIDMNSDKLIPWYVTLGNHDSYFFPESQILKTFHTFIPASAPSSFDSSMFSSLNFTNLSSLNFTNLSSLNFTDFSSHAFNWNLPYNFYSFVYSFKREKELLEEVDPNKLRGEKKDRVDVHFLSIDSWVLVKGWPFVRNNYLFDMELDWLNNQLYKSSLTSDFLIVMSHHTIRSVGIHGRIKQTNKYIKTLLDFYLVDAYLCGHDHHLETSHEADEATRYYVVGSASKLHIEEEKENEEKENKEKENKEKENEEKNNEEKNNEEKNNEKKNEEKEDSSLWYAHKRGFAYHSINTNEMETNFINSEGKILKKVVHKNISEKRIKEIKRKGKFDLQKLIKEKKEKECTNKNALDYFINDNKVEETCLHQNSLKKEKEEIAEDVVDDFLYIAKNEELIDFIWQLKLIFFKVDNFGICGY